MKSVARVVVAIPARNEATLLAGCLASVEVAIKALRQVRPDVDTVVVVGLDGCSDDSAAVAECAGVHALALRCAGVGPTRDAAIREGLSLLGDSIPRGAASRDDRCEHHTWVACTDADTAVPTTWLIRQVMWAESGMDLVIGTVEPTGDGDAAVAAAWHSRHRLSEGHPYVHGANLGMRADTWRCAGGFGRRTVGEDVALVARARQHTLRWVATDTTRVVTSARREGRAPGGFADYLDALAGPQ